MAEILEEFIPVGRKNRPGRKMRPQWITIHDTGNPNKGADALAHAKYLKGDDAANARVSWHFTVDDKRAVQHLPFDETAYHAGDGGTGPGNSTSIGIEICEDGGGDRAQAERNAAELVARLLDRLDLPVTAVVPHMKWNGKQCPHLLMPRWEGFIAQIESLKRPPVVDWEQRARIAEDKLAQIRGILSG